MNGRRSTRREFMTAVGGGAAAAAFGAAGAQGRPGESSGIDEAFLVRPEELTLRFLEGPAERRLSFARFAGPPEKWSTACRAKLTELLGYEKPSPCPAQRRRVTQHAGVVIELWVMTISDTLTIPAYLLLPPRDAHPGRAVMAIHGHGAAEPCIGWRDDYHHMFALRLAQAGHVVLCPALRGFGSLGDMAYTDENHWLDYWRSDRGRQFTLVTDGFLYGRTLIGRTVEDLLRWEWWLGTTRQVKTLDVAGISYGGDVSLTYPVFSEHIDRIYASGTLGSFGAIFARCYNAPAHCIPGVLRWMDRSDIAGLNAPRPIRLHYGELDTPGPHNASASYNEGVTQSLDELRTIYGAFGARDRISMHVTPNAWHEMDIEDLRAFLAG